MPMRWEIEKKTAMQFSSPPMASLCSKVQAPQATFIVLESSIKKSGPKNHYSWWMGLCRLRIRGVKYVTAKSPSCSIGFMEKDQNRFDRWLEPWSRSELLAYAESVAIPNASEIIDDNMLHVGGISRYAFTPNGAQNSVMNTVSVVGANELFKVVKNGLMGSSISRRLSTDLFTDIHQRTRLESMALRSLLTLSLSQLELPWLFVWRQKFKRLSFCAPLRKLGPSVAWAESCSRHSQRERLAAGGSFPVKEVGSSNETTLDLAPTAILQKDTKTLNKTNYAVQDINDRVVWPNPSYNIPAIDAFMLLQKKCSAFQMTVASYRGLDLQGTKALLKYFDSVNRELCPKQSIPQQCSLYFAVPTDTYNQFSAKTQPITGTYGVTLNTTDATVIGTRVKQWIMKIDTPVLSEY